MIVKTLRFFALAGLAMSHAQASPLLPLADTPTSAPPAGWVHTRINKDVPATRFSTVLDGDTAVMQAVSAGGASSLVHTLNTPLSPDRQLTWRWKVSNAVPGSSMDAKRTDDYAARVYVFFDYDERKLSLGQRARMDLARTFWGAELPTAALCYVWGTEDAIGQIGPNPYTDRVRMIVLQRGDEQAGQWVSETRDLAADFKAAFGEEAPAVTGVALSADTDNTNGRVQTRFADLRFEPGP